MGHPLKILFYDDAPDYGGHELMTMAAVQYIIKQPNVKVGFMFFRGNVKLMKLTSELAAQYSCFKPIPQDNASIRRQAFRTLLSWQAIRKIATMIADYAPDVMIVAQGGIAVSSVGLLAGKRLNIPVLSYIPMTHPESIFTSSRIKAALRELVSRIYYRLPDEFITISHRMEKYLRDRGLQQPVTVVDNGIDFTAYHAMDREAARELLGLSAQDWVVGLIGRVEFWQKRFDLAVNALAIAKPSAGNIKLLVVGDGPDLAELNDIARAKGVENCVVFVPWTDNMSMVYAAIDALAIPSRYEGVPLVMLEAMYFRLPVIASAVDGMLDILPPQWLFPSGDEHALAERLIELAKGNDFALLSAHRELVLQKYSRPAFEAAFMCSIFAAIKRYSEVNSKVEIELEKV